MHKNTKRKVSKIKKTVSIRSENMAHLIWCQRFFQVCTLNLTRFLGKHKELSTFAKIILAKISGVKWLHGVHKRGKKSVHTNSVRKAIVFCYYGSTWARAENMWACVIVWLYLCVFVCECMRMCTKAWNSLGRSKNKIIFFKRLHAQDLHIRNIRKSKQTLFNSLALHVKPPFCTHFYVLECFRLWLFHWQWARKHTIQQSNEVSSAKEY